MPTEQLILRRVFPVPVTFADLRRAGESLWSSLDGKCRADLLFIRGLRPLMLGKYATAWHAAIKESTGALDEVYAVIDGREVRVAVVAGVGEGAHAETTSVQAPQVNDLLIKADEAGYWQRPHEVRHVIEESMMSTRTRDRIALNSFAVAVATEWTDALIVAAGDDQ